MLPCLKVATVQEHIITLPSFKSLLYKCQRVVYISLSLYVYMYTQTYRQTYRHTDRSM